MYANTENSTQQITVECYEKIDFKGKKITINQNHANLEKILESSGFDAPISSIRIVRGADLPSDGTEVAFYGQPDFEGLRLPIQMDPKYKQIDLPNLLEFQEDLDFFISSIKIEN